jgi:rRNA maturation protein Nop10
MNEQFYCVDCFKTGGLTVHGKCARCGSDAVHTVTVPPRFDTIPEEEYETTR